VVSIRASAGRLSRTIGCVRSLVGGQATSIFRTVFLAFAQVAYAVLCADCSVEEECNGGDQSASGT